MDARTMHPSRIARDLRLVGDDAGILVSAIGDEGAWATLRRLRAGMRAAGAEARLSFLLALAADGRIVDLSSPDGTVFVAGYRLVPPDRVPVEPIT